MAEIEEALVAYLKLQSGLTSLVNNKIYPEEIPQKNDLPAIAYIKISDIKRHMLTEQNPLEEPFIQFTVYADTKSSARAVLAQIKTALKDYVGTLSGVVIQKIQMENEISNMETGSDGIKKIYTEDAEFQIFYERS